MRKILLIFACLLLVKNLYAQVYERPTPSYLTMQHRIHVFGIYEKNKNGFYQFNDYGKDELVYPFDYLRISKGNERFFSYDKKNNRFYFYTDNVIGYYCPTNKAGMDDAKKKIKELSIPLVSLDDVLQIKNRAINILDNIYKIKNDSINEQIRMANEKRYNDSIEVIKKQEQDNNEYRKNHNWHDLNLNYEVIMTCRFCNDVHRDDNLFVISLSSDTIYYLRDKPDVIMLGNAYSALHYNEITSNLRDNKKFRDYITMWRDSIEQHNQVSNADAKLINLTRYIEFKDKISKIAPYGFIKEWGWDLNSACGIEPFFVYQNTSNKTIKYVDFYFSIYNAVGDKCFLKYDKSYTGSVRGVGPVEPDNSSLWSWDRATHYTSADASEMRITKIVITYMDKTTKILTGNNIIYN